MILIILVIFVLALVTFQQKTDQDTGKLEVVVENLKVPWSIDFLPDGTMIFTERDGMVNKFDRGVVTNIGDINVNQRSESGLLGIAVDPEFRDNNFVYIYYTYDEGNRVSRYLLEDTLIEETVILDGIPNARFHDGGRIKFGPDGKLYVTTGDATEPSSAQNINSLAGKILRLNKDGSVPDDNPFNNYVYSYGHRNPQGIAWHPITNQLYASEHGPTKNDEVNIIEKGENYGWPIVQCDELSQEYENPISCYSEFTLAPSGIAFYNNDLLVAGLRGSQLRSITVDAGAVLKEEELISNLGRIRDVVVHDGYIYVATNNKDGRGIPRVNDDKILKFR